MGKSKRKMSGIKKNSEQARDYVTKHQRYQMARDMQLHQNGIQQALDIAATVLHEEFGFGPERNFRFGTKFMEKFDKVQNRNIDDMRVDKDGWYSDQKFEDELRAAFGKHYQPREVRYCEDGA